MANNSIISDIYSDDVMTYQGLEQLIWSLQEEKIKPYEALSFGQYGVYAYGLINNPAMMVIKNGEVTDKKIKHYLVMLNEQEQVSGSLYGLRTGREIVKTSKQTVVTKSDPFAIVDSFESTIHNVSGKPDNDKNSWVIAWRLAYAKATNLLSDSRFTSYVKQTGISVNMLQFAVKNWRTMSPNMLNQKYQNDKAAQQTPKKTDATTKQKITPDGNIITLIKEDVTANGAK